MLSDYQKACKNALDVQDACNFSGVLLSFVRDVTTVADHMRAVGSYGSQGLATHPVCVAYIEKLVDLQGQPDYRDVNKAFDALRDELPLDYTGE